MLRNSWKQLTIKQTIQRRVVLVTMTTTQSRINNLHRTKKKKTRKIEKKMMMKNIAEDTRRRNTEEVDPKVVANPDLQKGEEGQGAEVVAAAEIVIPIIDEITDHMTTIGEDQGIDSTDRDPEIDIVDLVPETDIEDLVLGIKGDPGLKKEKSLFHQKEENYKILKNTVPLSPWVLVLVLKDVLEVQILNHPLKNEIAGL